MVALLKPKLLEVVKAVAPLIATVCAFQVLFVHAPLPVFLQFLVGSVLTILGMMLLFVGVDLGVLPMGRFIGAELPARGSLWLICGVTFALGFATTVAEPDVIVLAAQVRTVSEGAAGGWLLVYAIAGGVGIFAVIALLRVIWNVPMTYLLAGTYGLMIVLSFFAPADFVPLAFDGGSVTTGVLTAPVLLAVALGMSSVLANRSPLEDGFGLLGLASTGPIIVLLLLGMFVS